jgi:hyperosmotically inducible protein
LKALQITVLPISLCGCLALSGALAPPRALAQDSSAQATSTQSTSPDNSGRNKAHRTTAEQQSSSTEDRQMTANIRKSIVGDKSLSTYAHNVKIITRGGQVTLKGPVHTEEEKNAVAAKAAEVAGGQDKVTNQLTVKQ